jgi:hypothetical protein
VAETTEDTVLLLVLFIGFKLLCELTVEELLEPNSLPMVGMLLGLDNDLGRPSCVLREMTLLIVAYFS